MYTGETEAIEWEGLAHSYALGGEQGRPRTQVPPRCLQTGRRQAEGPGPGMPGCGRVRAQLAPSLSPGPLTPLRAPLHPQAPWRSGRSSPSTLAATSAQPATRQVWPTNTWPSLCKVGPPALLARQPRPVGQGAGAELEAGGAGTEVKIEAPDLPLVSLSDGAPPASSVPRFLEPPFPSVTFLLEAPWVEGPGCEAIRRDLWSPFLCSLPCGEATA